MKALLRPLLTEAAFHEDYVEKRFKTLPDGRPMCISAEGIDLAYLRACVGKVVSLTDYRDFLKIDFANSKEIYNHPPEAKLYVKRCLLLLKWAKKGAK